MVGLDYPGDLQAASASYLALAEDQQVVNYNQEAYEGEHESGEVDLDVEFYCIVFLLVISSLVLRQPDQEVEGRG